MKARRSDRIPMVGKRYGRLVVTAELPRPPGMRYTRVEVRCDCGRVYATGAQHLRNGASKQCAYCRDSTAPDRARSVILPDGVTVADIARLTGLKLDTVYHRYIRGWPRHRLGEAPPADGRAR